MSLLVSIGLSAFTLCLSILFGQSGFDSAVPSPQRLGPALILDLILLLSKWGVLVYGIAIQYMLSLPEAAFHSFSLPSPQP